MRERRGEGVRLENDRLEVESCKKASKRKVRTSTDKEIAVNFTTISHIVEWTSGAEAIS